MDRWTNKCIFFYRFMNLFNDENQLETLRIGEEKLNLIILTENLDR